MSPPPRLGKYEIRRELGRGSMGVVYEAFDPFIQRRVAIKVIRQDELQPSQMRELLPRLRREAQAAGRLSHPGIVAIYDYGEDETLGGSGVAYIAMELIDGHELKDYLDANHPFTRADIVRIMNEVLAALQHAHERGVTHRDIKPSNVILLRNGSVKVADFGVARLDSSEMTQAGTMIGTPMYMAPEQILGLPVDGRCDLFACGVVLYQFLTGEKPFTGSLTTVMQKVLHMEPVPVTQLNAELAPEWDAVLKKALAKKPEQRFASAQAMAEAVLAAALAPPPTDQVTVLLPPRQPHPMVAPVPAPFYGSARSSPASAPAPLYPPAAPAPRPAAPVAAPAPVPSSAPVTRGPNRSFSPAPPAVAGRPPGGPPPPVAPPAWAPRGGEEAPPPGAEGEYAPTVRYTLKHLRPGGGEGPPSVPAGGQGAAASGFATSRLDLPSPAARRPTWWLPAVVVAVLAGVALLAYLLWPSDRAAAARGAGASAPLPQAPPRTGIAAPGGTGPAASSTGSTAAPTAAGTSVATPSAATTPQATPTLAQAPAGAGSGQAAPAAASATGPPAQASSPRTAAVAGGTPATPRAGPTAAPAAALPGPAPAAGRQAAAATGLPAAPATTALPPTAAAAPPAQPSQAPEWRQRVARLESARQVQSLAEALALLLEPLTSDERALLTEFEAQARQRIGAQVVVLGVQDGYLRTAWSVRPGAPLSTALEAAHRRCTDFPAKGCSTVMLSGSFQRQGLVAVAGELGALPPAQVRSRLLRNVERTLTEWRAAASPATAPGVGPTAGPNPYPPGSPAGTTTAATTQAPTATAQAPSARTEAAADPARGDWATATQRLRTEAPASLAGALEMLLHVSDAEDRERLRQLETALKRLRWKSAAALGDRNGYLWLNVVQGESRTQWAQDQALATCVGRGAAAPCVLVMTDGQFSTGGLAGLGSRFTGRNQAQVREAFMRQLQRTLQSGLN